MSESPPIEHDPAKRRVLAVTVARSDYGIYRPVLDAIEAQEALDLELLVSGAHLAEGGEATFAEILADKRKIVAKVPLPPTGGDPQGAGFAMAEALAGGCRVLWDRRPDLLLVLGDRFEMFAFAASAVPLGIPIAHVHGGELSYGAIDEVCRHAITKMAHLHFAATEEYGRRLRQMGEEPWRVTVSGAPALDTMRKRELPDRSALSERFGIPLDQPPILVTYHPVTRNAAAGVEEFRMLTRVLEATGLPLVLTGPNADSGADSLRKELFDFVARLDRAHFVESFGAENYLAMLREAACVVGNSSSGIIETPSFHLPAVNVGNRQAGRTRAPNVIDVDASAEAITAGVAKALDPEFRRSISGIVSPYGDGHAGERIAAALASTILNSKLMQKKFIDM